MLYTNGFNIIFGPETTTKTTELRTTTTTKKQKRITTDSESMATDVQVVVHDEAAAEDERLKQRLRDMLIRVKELEKGLDERTPSTARNS